MKTQIIVLLSVMMMLSVGTAYGEVTIKNGNFKDGKGSYDIGQEITFANHDREDLHIQAGIYGNGTATAGNSWRIIPTECGTIDYVIGNYGNGTIIVPCLAPEPQIVVIPEIAKAVIPEVSKASPQVVTPQVVTPQVDNSTVVNDTFILDGKSIQLAIEDYQGNESFLRIIGENFTATDGINITITDPNGLEVVNVNTVASNSGDFNVPAIVTLPDFVNGDYVLSCTSAVEDIHLTVSYNGLFDIKGVYVEPSPEAEVVTNNTENATQPAMPNMVYDWDGYISGLSVQDRLVKATTQKTHVVDLVLGISHLRKVAEKQLDQPKVMLR